MSLYSHHVIVKIERNRTSTIVVMYSLYLYFLGLSLWNASKTLVIIKDDKRGYVSVWICIKIWFFSKSTKRKVSAFIIENLLFSIFITSFTELLYFFFTITILKY
ncbi:MAG TPA: hypothetical protein VFK40_13100 [Nitrososphaeraceae archaeon]|nr:hypothetical protein [Nitrososphaeraceae archaeon]